MLVILAASWVAVACVTAVVAAALFRGARIGQARYAAVPSHAPSAPVARPVVEGLLPTPRASADALVDQLGV